MNWPTCPPTLKSIQPILKIAVEHDDRDIVVAYWARVYALQVGLKASTRQEDEMKLLYAIMDWLEKTKQEHADNEAITQEVVSQAHLENYALKLFTYADKQDRSSNFNKNVVKAFYSCAVIYDIMQIFGELTEEVSQNRKYAKWKAAYIHNCLKNGVTPVPGPPQEDTDELGENETGEDGGNVNPPTEQPTTPQSPEVNAPPTTTPQAPLIFPTEPGFNISDNLPAPTPQPTIPTQPFDGPSTSSAIVDVPEVLPAAVPKNIAVNPKVGADQIMQAQKFCKYAASALNYDDVKTAVENLQKALGVLTTNAE